MKKASLLCIASLFGVCAPAQNKLTVNADQGKDIISKHIYGHFFLMLKNKTMYT